MKSAAALLAAVLAIAASAHGQPGEPVDRPSTQPAPTYQGKQVSNEWVDQQYAKFSKLLFMVNGKVVNILETNFFEGGKLVDVAPKATTAPDTFKPMVGWLCDFKVFTVVLTKAGEYQGRLGAETFNFKSDDSFRPQPKITYRAFFLCRDPDHFVFARLVNQYEFLDYIRSGQPLISGYRDITAEEAQGMKESDYRLFKNGDTVKFAVPIVVPTPEP